MATATARRLVSPMTDRMTATFFKAVRPDGTSFHDPTFRWLPEDGVIPEGGWLVEHPSPAARIGKHSGASASDYLSVATVATDCTGFRWPCRLLEVEPVGRACLDSFYLSKRRVRAARVVRELAPHLTLGPQGEHVAALIERAGRLTRDEERRVADALDACWFDAARHAVWYAAWSAAWRAAWTARDAAQDAAQDAARSDVEDAVLGLLARDLISTTHYDALTLTWRRAVGRIHPDDAEAVAVR